MKMPSLLVSAALLIAAPLAAQQPAASTTASTAPAATAPATPPDTARTGPRVSEPQRSVRPGFRSASEASMRRRDSETLTVSTLGLVLLVVIIVLLVR